MVRQIRIGGQLLMGMALQWELIAFDCHKCYGLDIIPLLEGLEGYLIQNVPERL